MIWRTSWSAEAVTVQVLRTTREASLGMEAGERPWPVRLASSEAPSAWEARQPKFWTKKLLRVPPVYQVEY